MGGAKRAAEERYERGYDLVDAHIGWEHLLDEGLRESLADEPQGGACSFCDSGHERTVGLDAVLDQVMQAVQYFYEDATVLPWDSEDRTFVGPVYEIEEVLADLCSGAIDPSVEDEVKPRIEEAFGTDKQWTDWGALGDVDRLHWQWDDYAELVRTTTRFVIDSSPVAGPPRTPPEQIGSILRSFSGYVDGALGLVTDLPSGTVLYRGRLIANNDEFEPTAENLGPAPSARCGANRMSSAGVSLMYASADPQTAVAEIAGHGVKPKALVAAFRITRDLKVLDLTKDPDPGSVFSATGRENFTMAAFLRAFVNHVTSPVIPDGREHIEYAPTQVLTEYFRWATTTHIDGLALPSSQTGQKTFVLFFGHGTAADLGELTPTSPFPHLGDDPAEEPIFILDSNDVTLYNVVRTYSAVLP